MNNTMDKPEKEVPVFYHEGNPCYLESNRIPYARWIGVCEIDGKNYNGYVTEGGYFHVVKMLIEKDTPAWKREWGDK